MLVGFTDEDEVVGFTLDAGEVVALTELVVLGLILVLEETVTEAGWLEDADVDRPRTEEV